MSILTRIRSALTPEKRDVGLPTDGISWTVMGGQGFPRQDEGLAAVQACVSLIASTIASLPAYVYATTDAGRTPAPSHPVSRLLNQPNAWQTWPDYLESIVSELLLQGNSLTVIGFDGRGAPVSLTPIAWSRVTVRLGPSGSLVYVVAPDPVLLGVSGRSETYTADQVLHLKERSSAGYVGVSRLSRSPAALAQGHALEEFSRSNWENGATPSIAVTFPAGISTDGMKRMKAYINSAMTGTHNAGKIFYGDNGSVVTPLSLSLKDAELLGSRVFSLQEICRIFGVPASLVGDATNSTFANASQAFLSFATLTLSPIIRKIEAGFASSVFASGGNSLEIDMSGLQRGDYATRMAAEIGAVNAGVITADEAREIEGFQPMGGDAAKLRNPSPVAGGDTTAGVKPLTLAKE